MLWFVVKTTRPHFAVLGQIPGTQAYRNVNNHPEAERVPNVLMVRMDAQFYFGNVSFLKEKLAELERDVPGGLKAVIIDASSMNQLDSSAVHALSELLVAYRDRGVQLMIANAKRPVTDVMERAHLLDALGETGLFLTVHEAAEHARSLPVPSAEDRAQVLEVNKSSKKNAANSLRLASPDLR